MPGLTRASRLGWRRAHLSGMAGSSRYALRPAMTKINTARSRRALPDPNIKQPSLVRSRGRFPAGVFRSLSMCSICSPLLQKRERSAVTARIHQSRAPAKSTCRPCDRPARLTALHCGVFKPWGPASLWSRSRGFRRSGGFKERALRAVVREEAGPRSPGSRFARPARGRRSPSALSFALQSAPQRMGMISIYIHSKIMSKEKYILTDSVMPRGGGGIQP